MRTVGHLVADLDAPIHGAGVHDQRIGMRQREAPHRDAELPVIGRDIRKARVDHALVLDPQRHHYVGAGQTLGERGAAAGAGQLGRLGHQLARADQPELGHTQRPERLPRRTRDARMPHVAHHGDYEPRGVCEPLPDRQCVEQPLRRMREMRLARVQHAHVRRRVTRDPGGQTRLGVAQHEYVDRHRLQRVDRVEHGLALYP